MYYPKMCSVIRLNTGTTVIWVSTMAEYFLTNSTTVNSSDRTTEWN